MFSIVEHCKSLVELPDISKWKNSKLKNIKDIFFNESELNKIQFNKY